MLKVALLANPLIFIGGGCDSSQIDPVEEERLERLARFASLKGQYYAYKGGFSAGGTSPSYQVKDSLPLIDTGYGIHNPYRDIWEKIYYYGGSYKMYGVSSAGVALSGNTPYFTINSAFGGIVPVYIPGNSNGHRYGPIEVMP